MTTEKTPRPLPSQTPSQTPSATPRPRPKLSTSAKAALITIPAVLALLLVLILIAALNQAGAASTPRSSDNAAAAVPMVREDSHVLDEAGTDAPTLVEFLDFECEACAALHPVVEDIRSEYEGKINFVVRYFPIPGHLNSMNAALAVEAAAQQGEFEAMYRVMFDTQLEWGERQESEAPRFRGFAAKLGLDLEKYDAAVADPATEKRVQADFDAGQSLGVQGTPSFFVDGELLDPTQVSDITDALDMALAARE